MKHMENRETELLDRLKARFTGFVEELSWVKPNRVFAEVHSDQFLEALQFSRDELGFDHLCTITGLDNGSEFEFIYQMALGDMILSLKRRDGRGDNVVIPSVLGIFAGATFYERELEGLLGVRVDGLPEGRQYPLPDNWPAGEYPMRKGWKKPEL